MRSIEAQRQSPVVRAAPCRGKRGGEVQAVGVWGQHLEQML